jgi:transcription elongation factor GreB
VSKAFTKESDLEPEEPPRGGRPPLPAGAKNYITPDGAQRLREELEELTRTERLPRGAGRDSEPGASVARDLDRRIGWLQDALASATIAGAPATERHRVRFGAFVTVRSRGGEETDYRIVGVDETDTERGWISWLSPLARALLGHCAGDRIRFRFPAGEEELEVTCVRYEEVSGASVG